jgi:cell division protein FtsW
MPPTMHTRTLTIPSTTLRLPVLTFNAPTLLFVLSLGLVATGTVAVYSASASTGYLVKQLVYAALGLLAMLICYGIDYRAFKGVSLWLMLGALLLCVLVFVPGVGFAAKGAHRWIKLGPVTIQPSEFAKLALILYMARMLTDRRQYIKSFWMTLFPAGLITGLFAFIIVVEPDFGAAFVLFGIIFCMWLAAEVPVYQLMVPILFAIPAGVYFFLIEPYRLRRLVAFAFPDKETIMGAGFQLHQSLIAVGSGGMHGLGLGQSHQKFHYLTEAHTDFIFAIICEEMGFIRASLIVAMYAAMVLTGWLVALRTPDLFGSLLASGITLMFFIGGSINMAVVLGLLPTKGLVLPFISAGGSSLIVCMAAMGILMNVARHQYGHGGRGLDMT